MGTLLRQVGAKEFGLEPAVSPSTSLPSAMGTLQRQVGAKEFGFEPAVSPSTSLPSAMGTLLRQVGAKEFGLEPAVSPSTSSRRVTSSPQVFCETKGGHGLLVSLLAFLAGC